MKKSYVKPTTLVVNVEMESQLLQASEHLSGVTSNLSGDDAITYGGGSNQAARVKGNSVSWDDWDN